LKKRGEVNHSERWGTLARAGGGKLLFLGGQTRERLKRDTLGKGGGRIFLCKKKREFYCEEKNCNLGGD